MHRLAHVLCADQLRLCPSLILAPVADEVGRSDEGGRLASQTRAVSWPSSAGPSCGHIKAYIKLAELKRGPGITQSFRVSAFQTPLSRMETLVVCSLIYIDTQHGPHYSQSSGNYHLKG